MQFWQAEVVVLQIENFTFFNARESPVEFLSSVMRKKCKEIFLCVKACDIVVYIFGSVGRLILT